MWADLSQPFPVKMRQSQYYVVKRGGSGWLDSVEHSLSGAWRIADYAAVCRVVRLSSVHLVGRLAVKRLMRSGLVVEPQIAR
jgi:hypothetical protein